MVSTAAKSELTVLHVAQPTSGGVPRFVCALAADQTRRGWRVAVAAPAYGPFAAAIEVTGAEHVEWTADRAPGPAIIPEARKLKRIVDTLDPDVVHLHSSKAGLVGRLALRGRRPTVFQPHAWSFEAADGALARGAAVWERAAARWTDMVLCVSRAECDRGETMGIRCDKRVVVNGVDLDQFGAADDAARTAARRRLGIDGTRLVVCVGRLIEQKGQDVLIEAWRSITAGLADARLVFVGDGPDRDELEARASGDVVFTGERDDVPDWLAAADVVVFPSRWEGMSLAMLEAMATARSVVATDVDGAREALGDEAGAVVGVEDPAALARAIVDRLSDPARAAREGAAGRRRVEQRHDVQQAAESIATIYGDLAERTATAVAVHARA